jgi:general stress protein YciG
MPYTRIAMTKKSPRIYTYKITFEGVPYYYYGAHVEKKFDEEYWGSPSSDKNKWCWQFYIPKKQILELFDYTDEGWLEALNIEKRLITPVYGEDKWCLNMSCGGKVSRKILRENGKIYGKIGGKKAYEMGVGIHALTKEEKSELGERNGQKIYGLKIGVHGRTPKEMSEHGKKGGKIAGQKNYEMGVGIHALTKEQKSEAGKLGGKISGKKVYVMGVGIHAQTKEERINNGKLGGKISGKKAYELKIGVHGRTPEEMSEHGKKGGKAASKVTNAQRWQCTITGYVSTSGGLSSYQKARGVHTSNRIRIK